MKLLIELPLFSGVALAAHLALFAQLPEGAQSSGAGGGDALSIEASNAALAALVAAWERPPHAATDAPAVAAPPAPEVLQMAALPQPLTDTPAPAAAAALAAPPLRSDVALPAAPPLARPPDAPSAGTEMPLADDLPATPAPAAGAMSSRLAADRPALAQPQPAPDDLPAHDPAPPSELAPTVSPQPLARPAPQPPRPPAAQSAASPARAEQRAAGAGGGTVRGQTGAAEAGLSDSARQSLMAGWGGQIRAQIARGQPRGRGRGTVHVQLTVSDGGRLQGVALAGSSGDAALDRLALTVVQRAGRFPAAPAGLGAGPHSFRLPLRFE